MHRIITILLTIFSLSSFAGDDKGAKAGKEAPLTNVKVPPVVLSGSADSDKKALDSLKLKTPGNINASGCEPKRNETKRKKQNSVKNIPSRLTWMFAY